MKSLLPLPLPSHWEVAPLLRFILLGLVSLYMGTQTVGSFLRWLLKPAYPKLCQPLEKKFLQANYLAFILGFLPYATLALLTTQMLGTTELAVFAYYQRIGGIFLLAYIVGKLTKVDPYMHALTAFLWFIGLILWSSLETALGLPYLWHLFQGFIPFLFSIQTLTHGFLCIGLAGLFLGSWWLFSHLAHPEKPQLSEKESKAFQTFGWLTLIFSGFLALIMLVWDLYTAPFPSLNERVFHLGFGIAIGTFFIAFLAGFGLPAKKKGYLFLSFLLSLTTLGLYGAQIQTYQFQGSRETLALVASHVEEAYGKLKEEQTRKYTQAEPSLALGEEIFNTKCTTCHAWDHKVVGPPYNEVIPKYEGNEEALAAFIKNPTKVNPDYPAMPNQGLNDLQARSVAQYLLSAHGGKQ